jgi:hypothetical protein
MENHHFQWENPVLMVIFNSYVSHNQRVNPQTTGHPHTQARALDAEALETLALQRQFLLKFLT